MSSLLRWAKGYVRRPPFLPLQFLNTHYETISASQKLEEEHFKLERYYPAQIGEVLVSRYQVVGKLGFGVSSTVWLARDLEAHRHVALKIFTRDSENSDEIEIYKSLNKGRTSHPGHRYIRTSLDSFTVFHKGRTHHCLVHKPLWDSLRTLLTRNPSGRFTEELLRASLYRLFLALDYLHTEASIIHTDIKADNIMQEIEDESIIDAFVRAEMESPSPRKFHNSLAVYTSRQFILPKSFGEPVLCDFGSAVYGDVPHDEDVQPNVYRSPEVILKTQWNHSIDIWNVGVMIWDLFEGKHMFYGNDPDDGEYSSRAHLAEMISFLGMPPQELLKRGKRSLEFFTEDGQWRGTVKLPKESSLETSEEYLEGRNKEFFLQFIRSMLQWDPEDRKTAKQLLDDPWLNGKVN